MSVVTSIAGLLQTSTKITGTANQLCCSYKDAPASICRIKEEIGQLNLILRQIQRLIEWYERKSSNQNRLTMLPLHDLMTILTDCASTYSALEKMMTKAARFVDEAVPVPQTHAHAPCCTGSTLMGVEWDLEIVDEAVELVKNIERHKLSLHIMLTIIQRYLIPTLSTSGSILSTYIIYI